MRDLTTHRRERGCEDGLENAKLQALRMDEEAKECSSRSWKRPGNGFFPRVGGRVASDLLVSDFWPLHCERSSCCFKPPSWWAGNYPTNQVSGGEERQLQTCQDLKLTSHSF